MPFRINNALTNAQMEYNLDHCTNTTVGDEKYQFYCQTKSNLDGACTRIPSQYLTNGLDCVTMATDAWLEKVYSETGLNCGINCYYYGYGIPTINIPTINVPTFSYDTGYYTTTYPGGAATTPVDTFSPSSDASSASSTPTPSSTLSVASSASSPASDNSAPTIGTGPAISSAQSMSPNLLLLTVFLVSVIALFRRIQ